jgi:fatty-acyl-CoA synthase
VEANPSLTLPKAFDDVAARRGDALALMCEFERMSFRELSERSNQYARWALQHHLAMGDVVALMMENRADYIAVWLGLTRVGVVVALLNTSLTGEVLAHCIRASGARLVIASARYRQACGDALAGFDDAPKLVVRDAGDGTGLNLALLSGDRLGADEERDIRLSHRALYIFTSGTTGMPKAAIVSHRRVMHWATWFAALMNTNETDRIYDCLPLYHAVGGVVAAWSVLLGGGSVVIRQRFSASRFWRDVVETECTLFQYIGELCRYLLNAPVEETETQHKLRLIAGNGLRADVWPKLQARFSIPRILEFYAATESNFSLYNVEGEPGAIGRVPAFVAAQLDVVLLKFDIETGIPIRDSAGRCIRAGTDEIGEAVAKVETRPDQSETRFEGYLSEADSAKKILRDVFAPGDAWMRSGDLMRKDARGFYYFIDRIGDTFRWKGENVSTDEVAQVILTCVGVTDACVYGVEVPHHEGRAGMAAMTVDATFDAAVFKRHLEQLPPHARPLFLRIQTEIVVTETFKHKKAALAKEGFDPRAVGEPVVLAHPNSPAFVPIDDTLYADLVAGRVRL